MSGSAVCQEGAEYPTGFGGTVGTNGLDSAKICHVFLTIPITTQTGASRPQRSPATFEFAMSLT